MHDWSNAHSNKNDKTHQAKSIYHLYISFYINEDRMIERMIISYNLSIYITTIYTQQNLNKNTLYAMAYIYTAYKSLGNLTCFVGFTMGDSPACLNKLLK